MELTHLSLFSGIGGIDLAAEAAGFRTIAFVEQDRYCQAVLRKHWPDVPIFDDVRKVTVDVLKAHGITRVDLVSGGFPCQPFSVAGKRKGADDDRYLWPEMARVIREIRPRWVLGENVPGLLSIDSGRVFGGVVRDLAQMGYRVGWCVYGAGHVGAPHLRKRVFVVAYATGTGWREFDAPAEPEGLEFGSGRSPAARLHGRGEPGVGGDTDGLPSWLDGRGWPAGPEEEQYPWEPPRITRGAKHRAARIKALGNAVFPAQVYPILKAMVEAAPSNSGLGR